MGIQVIGESVAGAVVREQLGEGPRGIWWRAERDGEAVAVHSLGASASPAQRHEFHEALKRLKLVGADPEGVLVPLSIDPDKLAFTTRLCTDGTIATVPSLRLPLNRRILMLATLAEALERLHDRGITHGAVSPATVLLDSRYRPWLAGVDGENLLVGTPGDTLEDPNAAKYAAPEVRAGEKLDRRADIFSLGRILYYLLASRHPKEPDEELPRLEAISMSPAGLVRIIRKCTCKKPEDRYPMVDDLLRDLAKFGRHEEVGLSHPDIEERNITGISASVLPERFDLKARREARLKAEREAALFSMPPTDVPPRVRQLVVGVGLVCFIGALVAANFASTSSATTLMVLSMIGAGAVAVAMPAGTKRVWISRVVFILAAVSLVYVIDPTGLVRLSAARGRLEGATPGTREAAARELVGSGERDFTGVDLTNADLTELDLAGATFDGADLQSADFSGSDLNQATFVGADIRAATFDDANLTEVDLTLAEGLAEAYCNRGTYLPRGLRCQTNLLAVAQEN